MGRFLLSPFIYLYGYGIQITKLINKKGDNGQNTCLTIIPVDNIINIIIKRLFHALLYGF